MFRTECERIEASLASHAAGDLPARESRRVIVHLESCAACRLLNAEHEARTAVLRSLPTPEFDAEIYTEIRDEVLSRIRRETEASIFKGKQPFALPAWSYALPVALVALSVLIASYLFSGKRHDTRATHNSDSSVADIRQEKDSRSSDNTNTLMHAADAHNPIYVHRRNSSPSSRPSDDRAQSRRTLTLRSPNAPASRGDNDHNLQSTQGTLSSEVADLPALNAESIAEEIDSQANSDDSLVAASIEAPPPVEMMRIEIQTSDPTLRIIWLAPKTSNATQSGGDTNAH